MKTTTLLLAGAMALALATQADARGWGGHRGFGGYHPRGHYGGYRERAYKFEGLVVDRWPTVAEQVAASPATIRALQRALKFSGYYRGALDGKLTSETRNAIKRLQGADGVKPTGIADEGVFTALGLDAKRLLTETGCAACEPRVQGMNCRAHT